MKRLQESWYDFMLSAKIQPRDEKSDVLLSLESNFRWTLKMYTEYTRIIQYNRNDWCFVNCDPVYTYIIYRWFGKHTLVRRVHAAKLASCLFALSIIVDIYKTAHSTIFAHSHPRLVCWMLICWSSLYSLVKCALCNAIAISRFYMIGSMMIFLAL